MKIILHNNKPIACHPKTRPTEWTKIFEKITGEKLDFEKWRKDFKFNGKTLNQFKKDNNIKVFEWNEIGQEFYEQK